MLSVNIAGEPAELLPERALWLPNRRRLLIADPHFGKAGVFRRHGIPLPSGTTEDDLNRLGRLIARFQPEQLLILGDFFHARPEVEEPWLDTFARWRRCHGELPITVIVGNHDRHAGAPDPGWNLVWSAAEQRLGPFVLAHEPMQVPGAHVLAGHLHPVLRLRGRTDRLRLPVFWVRSGCTVLPSFGSFTGGHPVKPAAGDRVYAVGPGAVVDCTGARV